MKKKKKRLDEETEEKTEWRNRRKDWVKKHKKRLDEEKVKESQNICYSPDLLTQWHITSIKNLGLLYQSFECCNTKWLARMFSSYV